MSSNEMKLSLKIMVDTKTQKVVFAEARKDFVDFLFHILSLPLSTVVELLDKENRMGSLQALYQSVVYLKDECFVQNVTKDTVLKLKLPITLPLLSFHHTPTSLMLFKCPHHNLFSCRRGAECSCGYGIMQEFKLKFMRRQLSNEEGFVKETVPYVVMDDLSVKPMSVSLIKSLLNDHDCIEEKEVKFGLKEGLALLRASFETNNVFITVFLETKKDIPNLP